MAKTSAGLLLWRRAPSGGDGAGAVQVLLGHPGGPYFARKDDGSWSVPKGEYVPGEEPLAAAYREFAEELGVEPPAGDPVPLGHAKGTGGKVNTIWALEGDLDVGDVHSNTFTLEWPPRSGRQQEFPEIDRAEWFDLTAARVKIFAAQRPFLDRLAEHLGEG
jgi:predicted NUDIX family NTP pyrophosphohydrolase